MLSPSPQRPAGKVKKTPKLPSTQHTLHLAHSWASRDITFFPFSSSPSSKGPQNPEQVFPCGFLSAFANTPLLTTGDTSGLNKYILGKWESFPAVWKEAQMSGFLEQWVEHSRPLNEGNCANTRGGIRNDSWAVVSQHSPDSCMHPGARGQGGPHSCKVRCVSAVTNKKIGKLVSDSLETIIQQTITLWDSWQWRQKEL